MTKHRVPNIIRGGVALPLDKTNYYLVRGRKHEQGGIDIGKNPRTGLEVEDGEVVHVGDKELRVFSAEPILGGVSPSQLVVRGVNPDKVFAAQEKFKQVNGIKDDGTKAPFGTLKKLIFGPDFNGIKTSDGRDYNPDYIERAYSSLKKSGLTKQQQAVVLANIIEESGGNPFALNKNSGKDYGLLQWVDRYPKSNETDPYKEIDNQMKYFLSTVNNLDDQVSWTHGGKGSGYQSRKDAYNDFNSDDIETVNRGFVLGYVRPAGKHASAENRLNDSEQIYNRIKRFGGERKKAEWGMEEGSAADIITDMIPIVGSAKEITRLIKNPSWEQTGWTVASVAADALGLGAAKVLAKAAKSARVSKNYFKATKGVHKAVKLNPTIDRILFEGAMVQSPQIALEAAQHDNNKKQFGGDMKHKLVEVNIGGNSKLIRVPSRSSTGESERSEGLTRKRANIGATVKNFINSNSNLISDVIGVGSNIIGSSITKRINNKALNSLTFQKPPVALTPSKLKTKININPQLDKMRESLADYERLISGNTASSRVALGRINRVRNQGIANTNELYGQKENKETQLINTDRARQDDIMFRNLQQDYQYRANKNTFENEVRNLKAENKVANVQNIVTGIQDLLTRGEQRKMFNKTLTAETLANPNLPAEMYLKSGIWSKELYDMYRSQYPLKA